VSAVPPIAVVIGRAPERLSSGWFARCGSASCAWVGRGIAAACGAPDETRHEVRLLYGTGISCRSASISEYRVYQGLSS